MSDIVFRVDRPLLPPASLPNPIILVMVARRQKVPCLESFTFDVDRFFGKRGFEVILEQIFGQVLYLIFPGKLSNLREIIQLHRNNLTALIIIVAAKFIQPCAPGLAAGAEQGLLVSLRHLYRAHHIRIRR